MSGAPLIRLLTELPCGPSYRCCSIALDNCSYRDRGGLNNGSRLPALRPAGAYCNVNPSSLLPLTTLNIQLSASPNRALPGRTCMAVRQRSNLFLGNPVSTVSSIPRFHCFYAIIILSQRKPLAPSNHTLIYALQRFTSSLTGCKCSHNMVLSFRCHRYIGSCGRAFRPSGASPRKPAYRPRTNVR